jgi:hypothetical protein
LAICIALPFINAAPPQLALLKEKKRVPWRVATKMPFLIYQSSSAPFGADGLPFVSLNHTHITVNPAKRLFPIELLFSHPDQGLSDPAKYYKLFIIILFI